MFRDQMNHPVQMCPFHVNLADGVPLICAGKENGRISKHCWKYDKSSNTWIISGRQVFIPKEKPAGLEVFSGLHNFLSQISMRKIYVCLKSISPQANYVFDLVPISFRMIKARSYGGYAWDDLHGLVMSGGQGGNSMETFSA